MNAARYECSGDQLASAALGWCLALVVFSLQRIYTALVFRPHKIPWFFALCATLVTISAILAILSWFVLTTGHYFSPKKHIFLLVLWSLQAQVYFQIVVSRICILDIAKHTRIILRLAIGLVVLVINILMIAFWLLPKLEKTPRKSEFWMPRLEKITYLVLDAGLNIAFMIQVQIRLVRVGLPKYQKLIRHNAVVVLLSLLCDCLLVAMLWYPKNASMFIILQPVLYLNKLMLEMSVCDKMAVVSKKANVVHASWDDGYSVVEKHELMVDNASSASLQLKEPTSAVSLEKSLPRLPQPCSTSSGPLSLWQQRKSRRGSENKSKLSYYAISV